MAGTLVLDILEYRDVRIEGVSKLLKQATSDAMLRKRRDSPNEDKRIPELSIGSKCIFVDSRWRQLDR